MSNRTCRPVFAAATRTQILHAAIWFVSALPLTACSPSQQKPLLETAIDSHDQRQRTFEAMLRVLDEHPEYIPEFFAHARQHPNTLARLLRTAARHLHEDDLARLAAKQLVAEPLGLKATLIASLDEMQKSPEAMNAAAAALETRPAESARMLSQRDIAVKRVLREQVRLMLRDEHAAQAFREALAENSTAMATVITQDPELVGTLIKSFAKVGVDRGGDELQAFLRAYDGGD